MNATVVAKPGDLTVESPLAFPRAARLPVIFFLVSMPVSAATPLPAAQLDVDGEPLTDWTVTP